MNREKEKKSQNKANIWQNQVFLLNNETLVAPAFEIPNRIEYDTEKHSIDRKSRVK